MCQIFHALAIILHIMDGEGYIQVYTPQVILQSLQKGEGRVSSEKHEIGLIHQQVSTRKIFKKFNLHCA